jgi:anti-sigma B factor antagonist
MQGEPDFEVTSRPTLDGVVVTVRGEIDLVTIDAVQAQLDGAEGRVYLDLREVSFIDSAGIRLIVEGVRDLDAKGGELVVVRGPSAVQRLFDLVGLDGRVGMVDAPPHE